MDKLTIELVPETCWFSNVRSEVSPEEWDRIRKDVYEKAGHRCQVCGGVGPKHPVECHEIWEYDDKARTQRLASLIALCPSCHEVKHIGLAQVKGNERRARSHLATVNGWSTDYAADYIRDAFETWRERSRRKWKLDISYLTKTYGIKPKARRKS
jgi:hypothetical protein